jgi:dihydrofolate reductase
MQAIVAVDDNWGIGREGGMLFHLPEDLKHFRRLTLGKTVVMGRRTLDSLPGGVPLKDRHNIVLTRNAALHVPGAHVVHSLSELWQALKDTPPDQVILMGGGQIYALLIDCCDRAHVTHVRGAWPAEHCFPDLSTRPGWRLVHRGEEQKQNGLHYAFCEYENAAPRPLDQLS